MKILISLILLSVGPVYSFEINKSLEKKIVKVAQDEMWHRLLHYKKSWFKLGRLKSQADGNSFFLSPECKFNPHLELKQNIDNYYQLYWY